MKSPPWHIRATLESVFREESGRIISGLIRISGSFDRAEEAMQESFAAALAAWPEKGIPENPAAWIMTTAHRRLIDAARREQTRRQKQDSLEYETALRGNQEAGIEQDVMHIPDDRLRLIFTCCHPAIHADAQVALTLRTLGGLSTPEIAKAFLIPEPTLAQRLVRAKKKIQEARIPYEVPPPERLPERLNAVRSALYLIFNEGYSATFGAALVRHDLCAEAIRLARTLCDLMPREPENMGLLALMLLHNSRRDARVRDGALVTLEEQDRALWDRSEIEEGSTLVEKALRCGVVGPYQIQAAIAALHANARSSAETDWAQIAALYETLLAINPSPVIALNHAAAVAMTGALEDGLARMDQLAPSLAGYYLFHAGRADLLRRLHRYAEAKDAYRRAASLATNRVERDFLERRLQSLG